jgi:hypothetical protein
VDRKNIMKYKYTRKEIADNWETTIKYSGNDLIRDLLAQKEDKKECICNPFTKTITCPIHGIKSKSTPSPLEIEKIKEISLPYSDAEITINKLIRNQKKLYQFIKEKQK